MKDEKHPINKIMQDAMDKVKALIDVNTVIGDTVTLLDGTMIIPITKVSMGFVAGGGEYCDDLKPKNYRKEYPFAGGSGTGFSINPIGFLVGKEGNLKLITLENKSAYESMLNIVKNITDNLKKDQLYE